MEKFLEELRKRLIESGWKTTYDEYVLEKNGCHLNLETKHTICNNPINFVYTQEQIELVIKNDYSFSALDKDVIHHLNRLDNVNGNYYVEKGGWLLFTDKYKRDIKTYGSYNTEETLKEAEAFIKSVNDVAERDYLSLRGIKQHQVLAKDSEIYIETEKLSMSEIQPGCILEVMNNNSDIDVFKKGALFELVVLSIETVIVTAYNKKGLATNKHYSVDPQSFLEAAKNGDILPVHVVTKNRDKDILVWKKYSEEDFNASLDTRVTELICSEEQKELIYKLNAKCKNYSCLLNSSLSSEALSVMYRLALDDYCPEQLFRGQFSADVLRLYLQYVELGYDPIAYVDDLYDPISLEEDLTNAMTNAIAEMNRYIASGYSEEVAKALSQYFFKFSEVFPLNEIEVERWQYVSVYYAIEFMNKNQRLELLNTAKMYGTLTDDGVLIKSDYLSLNLKNEIIAYFVNKHSIKINGEDWNTIISNLVQKNCYVKISKSGVMLCGDQFRVGRDINSMYINHVDDTNIWRCIIINEEPIINSINESSIYF